MRPPVPTPSAVLASDFAGCAVLVGVTLVVDPVDGRLHGGPQVAGGHNDTLTWPRSHAAWRGVARPAAVRGRPSPHGLRASGGRRQATSERRGVNSRLGARLSPWRLGCGRCGSRCQDGARYAREQCKLLRFSSKPMTVVYTDLLNGSKGGDGTDCEREGTVLGQEEFSNGNAVGRARGSEP